MAGPPARSCGGFDGAEIVEVELKTMKPVPAEFSDKLMAAASAAATGPGLSMSMDDLAKASGVPRATLYYCFSGKDDLISFNVGTMLRRIPGQNTDLAAGHCGRDSGNLAFLSEGGEPSHRHLHQLLG